MKVNVFVVFVFELNHSQRRSLETTARGLQKTGGTTLDVSAIQHSAFVSQTPSKVSDQVSRGIELTGGWMVLFLSVDS